jgi:hypothetical protein
MTQDDIIRMAEEAELLPTNIGPTAETRANSALLEHFARLIERHLSYDGIHTCNDQCQKPACVATRKAVERVKENCAKVAEGYVGGDPIAAAIRARGEK